MLSEAHAEDLGIVDLDSSAVVDRMGPFMT